MKTKILVRDTFYTLLPFIFWVSVFLPPLIMAVVVGVNSPASAMGSFVAGLLTFVAMTFFCLLLGVLSFGLIFYFVDVADRIESIEKMLATNLRTPQAQSDSSGETGGSGDDKETNKEWSPI